MRRMHIVIAIVLAFAVGIGSTVLVMRRGHSGMGAAAPAAPDEKKVLYWYDPMVPDQHFDKPGKSPFMDMQLVPKYAGGGGDDTAGAVVVDPRLVQNLGIRTARAERGVLGATVRATGTVAFDERAVTMVQARVNGIVEQLAVRTPLAPVKQGQMLLTLLAPDWTAAQEEYLALRRSHTEGLDAVRDAARRRLLLLGMSEGQIQAIERGGQAQTRIGVSSPRDGVVGELVVREGASVMAGAPLMRINGLDSVWINAAVPEVQIGRVAPGADVEVELPAFPGEKFEGKIEALLADLDPATRTQTARVVVPNLSHRLAPGMFAQVRIAPAAHGAEVVLVPTDAVIATGVRHIVIVDAGEGHFRAQEVRVGDEAEGKTAVLEGLDAGDDVVLSGQFLIDSEASLSGALARLEGSRFDKNTSSEKKREVFRAQGTLKRIDGKAWTIDTDAIPALEMGAMAMTFVNPSPSEIKVGQRIDFSFFRNTDGDFEIEKIAASGSTR